MIGKNSKIFVAGHNGMIGSAIVRKLTQFKYKYIFVRSRRQLDLTDQGKVFSYLKKNKTRCSNISCSQSRRYKCK